MIHTVKLGKYASAQGVFVRRLEDGRMVVRDGDKLHVGYPVSEGRDAAA